MGWALAMAVAVAAVPAQADDPAGPPAAAAADVVRATLSNGLRVVIVPDRLAPVVTTELNYLAGSNDAPDGFPGMAHALEHMMFRGSEGLDKDQLAELGALLGGVYNADTTETVTRYTYTVPADQLDVALRAEAARMRAPSLRQADWEQERGAIEQEVSRDLSSPLYNYLAQAQAILFDGTPYRHDALGTRDSFDRTDATMLRDFHARWYTPNNAILVIVGDVQPERAMAGVQAAFGDIPARPLPAHPSITLNPVQARTLELKTDFPFGIVSIAYRMPGLKERDFAAADVLGDVLGGRRGPLYALVPKGQALLAQFQYAPKADVGVGVAFAAFPSHGDPAPLRAAMRDIMARAAQDGVPAELVEAAKRQELAQLAFSSDSIQGLAGTWSHALAQQRLDSPDDLARAYASVTVDDVNRLARMLLDPDHAVTAILTPQDSGAPTAGRGFGGGESFASAPDHPVALPDWAASALAAPHLPAPIEPPDVSVLPNGLRLIVQPEHVSHTVTVHGRVRNVPEMQEPAGQEGVAAVTGGLFDYGTQARDRLAFRKAIDDIAATERAGPNFSLKVLKSEFEAGMRLLAENELRPAFPEQAFEVVRGQAAQSVAGLLESPDYLFERAVKRSVVPQEDPTLRQATPETIGALRLADVVAYYRATFRPDLTTIVVVGDVTPAEARRVVAETFGGWTSAGPTPAIDLPPIGPSSASRAQVPDSSALQNTVTLSESVDLPVASPERNTLTLGNAILGSGFSSRLYQDLRIKTGYVYSVSSEFDWTRTRSAYEISFGADPENVAKARDLVVRDLRTLQTTPVSEAELTRAKAQLLRRLPMRRSSVDGIAALYLSLVDLNLPLDAQETSARHYLEITAPEIQKGFATWLRPDELSQVVKGPEPTP